MLRRSRNIGGLLADRLTGGGTDRGTHGYKMGNQVFYNTEGEEGKNFLKATDRYYTKDAERRLKKGQEASMADFGDEEGGGFVNETLGLLDPDSIGTEKKEYRDVDTEGDNRYLNKLAREEFAENEFIKSDDDLGFAENEPKPISSDISKFMGPEYQSSASYLAESDENALDAMARTEPERLVAERAKQIGMADSGMLGGEEEGSMLDKFTGLFASDEIGKTGKKKKKMSKGAMKVGADLLQGYLKEPAQGKRQMATSSITRGSVPFAGLLAQKAQRQKAPYYTPKGLV